MPSNDYAFLTQWRVEAPRDLVYEVLKQGERYPDWWPEVYLSAVKHPSGDPEGIGDRVDFHTRGRLPYRLNWTAEVVRHIRPHTIEIRATGDFEGSGKWTLTRTDSGTDIRFDWVIRAEKPLIRLLSPILKPVFSWNHQWAMAVGYERLREELVRRSAVSRSEK